MSSSSREREREYVKTNTGDLVSRKAQVHGSQNLYLKGKVREELGQGGRHYPLVRDVARMPDCCAWAGHIDYAAFQKPFDIAAACVQHVYTVLYCMYTMLVKGRYTQPVTS